MSENKMVAKAEKHMRIAFGGNMNTHFLKPLAIQKLMASFAKEELAAASQDWISVDDELPKDRQIVIIGNSSDVGFATYYKYSNMFSFNDEPQDNVTNWQPLPQPPKKG